MRHGGGDPRKWQPWLQTTRQKRLRALWADYGKTVGCQSCNLGANGRSHSVSCKRLQLEWELKEFPGGKDKIKEIHDEVLQPRKDAKPEENVFPADDFKVVTSDADVGVEVEAPELASPTSPTHEDTHLDFGNVVPTTPPELLQMTHE